MHIQSNPILNYLFQPLISFCKFLGRYNPTLLVKIRYFFRFRKFMSLKNPRTLNEKILYQSLKTDIDLRTQLTDKYRVREYIHKCELSEILVELYGVWDNAHQINFDSLPSSFVLKPNHGCGDIVVVSNKNIIDKNKLATKLNKDLKTRYGELEGGRHYYGIKPVVVAEELLLNDDISRQYSSSIIDYKIWCFNGKAYYIMTCSNRKNDKTELMIYDLMWKKHPEYMKFNQFHVEGGELPKPKSFNKMIEVAEILAKPFPVVRVDLYNLDGKIYFGEMTFTSLGGLMDYYSEEFQKMAGNLIDLSSVKKK